MEINENNLNALSSLLTQTLNPDHNVRKPAEDELVTLERNQNYPILLLKLIENDAYDLIIRISGSVVFKNYIKKNWKSEDGTDNIHENDRNLIKQLIITIMLFAPESIQKQLSDAIAIIGKHDFPDKWAGLLEEMISKFSGDFNIINGVLRTAHALFKKYRYEFKSQKLWTEIKFVLDTFAKPLTSLFLETIQFSKQQISPVDLAVTYNSLLMMCKIFFSLNYQDLPEIFEDNMKEWMNNFHYLIITDQPLLNNDVDEPGVMEQLRTQICENISMYARKYDEEFCEYIPIFVEDVWNLLVGLGPETKFDILICNALNFLSPVAGSLKYQDLFGKPDVLNGICEKVILPNLQFRISDEELFEDNPDEYIRRDIEGSDVDTRRKSACDLVKALANRYEQQISNSFSTYVQSILTLYGNNNLENWKCKNAAIFLVTSLSAKGQTQQHGVTQVSGLVNINDFAIHHILPELEKPNVNELPVIKADCIRYMMTFRSILPQDLVVQSLSIIKNFLSAESKVVHSYAAAYFEKVLTTQNTLILVDQINIIKNTLIESYFAALTKLGSAENDYVMKALLRTLIVLNDKCIPLMEFILPRLITKLDIVAKNPCNPNFNHALFETLALCVKIVCTQNSKDVIAFEGLFFPVFQTILLQDVAEFLPYVFQIFAMLLEFHSRGEPIPEPYLELYQLLFSPTLWARSGIARSLVRFIAAIISRMNSSEMPKKLQTDKILGIIQHKLILSKVNDHEGLYLLRILFEYCPSAVTDQYKNNIFNLLMNRLTQHKTVKYIKNLTVFLCFYASKYDISNLIEILNTLQKDLFENVLAKILLHEDGTGTNSFERKIIIIGLTKILSEVPDLRDGPNSVLWPLVLQKILRLLRIMEMGDSQNVILGSQIDSGVDTVNSKLVYSIIPEPEPFQDINVKELFAKNLLAASKMSGGKIENYIATLSAEDQSFIREILGQMNL